MSAKKKKYFIFILFHIQPNSVMSKIPPKMLYCNISIIVRWWVNIWREINSIVNFEWFCSRTRFKRAMPKLSLKFQCYDTLWLMMTAWLSLVLCESFMDPTHFYHLIPLAWRHILYTFTSALCISRSDATPVCRETDTWLFFFFW